MKSFKQFLLEDPQRGKTIIFYHRTGLGGQSRSHEHMKKENIEDHVDSFLKDGFHIGRGQLYGPGIYGFYTEDSMLDRQGGGYGNIVLKTKVNTDKILITVPEVAKKVYGRDITLEEQFKILKLKYHSEKMINWEMKYNRKVNVGLDIVEYYGKNKITKLIKGLVYRGGQDLEAMVVYDPKLLTVMGYNTTLNDSTKLDGAWINVLGKNNAQIKIALTTRLSVASSVEKLFNETRFLENVKKYVVKNYNNMSEREKSKLESRLIEYAKHEDNGINNLIELGIKPSDRVIAAAIDNGWFLPPKKIYDTLSPEQKKMIEKNQLAAAEKRWEAIYYIIEAGYTPSEAVQIASVKNNWRAIQDIIEAGIKPSDNVISVAIDGGWYYPSKEFYDKSSIELKEKVDENQITEVYRFGWAIINIIEAGYEPSEDVQLAAVKQDWELIKDIINAGYEPSRRVQIAAVEKYGEAIQSIIDGGYEPSKRVQYTAVKKNLKAIQYIKNIDDSVIRYVIDNYGKSEMSDILSKDFESKETKQKLQAAFDKKYK